VVPSDVPLPPPKQLGYVGTAIIFYFFSKLRRPKRNQYILLFLQRHLFAEACFGAFGTANSRGSSLLALGSVIYTLCLTGHGIPKEAERAHPQEEWTVRGLKEAWAPPIGPFLSKIADRVTRRPPLPPRQCESVNQ